MSTIEERIVSMDFDGAKFLTGIDKSLTALDKMNNKLKMQEGTKGLDDIGVAAGRNSSALTKIGSAVEGVAGKFKAMSLVGIAALTTITSQAVLAGENLVKSLAFSPITDGFHEYETNLNAIQTILANTASAGTNLKQVNAALNELNHYSDQTIYNFAEMAKNIGTFTAAGVDLKTSVASIKGLANLAALSGSSSEQASTAMYQLSQAISSGRVSLEDWNSVVNAGLGGSVFQRALAENAEKMGTLDKGAVKLKGSMKNVTVEGKSFRDSITAKPGETSWLTSDVLTRTLSQFTGDLSKAQLKAQGFNDAEIKAIQSQAKMAKEAATQVKTLTQLVGTVKESIGSGWTQTWQTIFGDFNGSRKLFTNINNVLGGYVTASSNARNKILADWSKMGGRTAIINSIGNSFKALVAFLRPLRDAFQEIFPPTTGKQLADISKMIESFTKNLTISGTTANNLKRTFAGFFAIIDIGWQVVKQLGKTILDILGFATKGSGGILNFTGNIGDFIVSIDQAIKSGDGLKNFFGILEKVIEFPIRGIKLLAGYLGQLTAGFDGNKAAASVKNFVGNLTPLEKLGKLVSGAWSKVTSIFSKVFRVAVQVGKAIDEAFGGLGSLITNSLSGINYQDFLNTLNTGLLGGIVLLIKRFVDKIKGGGESSGGGFLDALKEGIEGFTGTLQAMQTTLKATALLEIATAIGIMAIAMNVLAKIDAAGLTRASVAIGAMFTQLIGSMIAFQKISGFAGFAKMPIVAGALILLATAVVVLASAVEKLSGLSWDGLLKGLTGVTVLLGVLIVTVKLMPTGAKLIGTAAGLVIMAAAIKILASAVTDLSGMSWGDLIKGLTGVGALLAGLTLFTKFSVADKGALTSGAGLILLATGIKILASALGDIAKLSWPELIKGLVGIAGALIIITGAMEGAELAIPGAAAVAIVSASLLLIAKAMQQFGDMSWSEIAKSMTVLFGSLLLLAAGLDAMEVALPGAAALIVATASLGMLANAMTIMGGMSWEGIGKAMTVLFGSLLLLAAGLTAMIVALPGAAALVVAAAGLMALAPALQLFADMKWGDIFKALGILLITFTAISVGSLLLAPAIPILIGFGAAVVLLGAGMALAGVGMLAFGAGLTLLAASGVAAASALVGILTTLLGAVPQIVDLVGALLVALANLIINTAPVIAKAFIAVMDAIIAVIGKESPAISNLIAKLMVTLVNVLAKYVPSFVSGGVRLVNGLLNGLAKNVGSIVTAATNLIVAFINAISKNQSRVVDAGVKLIINFVNGIASSIRKNSAAMNAAGRNLGSAIVEGMVAGVSGGISGVASAARNVAQSALSAAKAALGIHSPSKEFEKIGNYVNDGLVKGLMGNKAASVAAIKTLTADLKAGMSDSAKDVTTLTAKLKKLKSARHKDYSAINATAKALAQAKKEHKAESAAYTEVTKKITAQQKKLGTLADQYDAVTAKIKTATDTYNDALKTRDDFNKQITDQFSDIATPGSDETTADYVANLQKQVEDTKTFANELQQLRKMGLNDETYKDLLGAGITDLPFVTQLLNGGQAQISQINALNQQLDSVSATMGKNASTALYQAAVDSAAGIVKGLQNQQAAIEKQMDTIADAMVNSIKKKLGIKSPSRVFAQLGKYTSQGLANGLDASAELVANSTAAIGDQAISALQTSLSGIGDIVTNNIDVQPTITPVLDLTNLQSSASKIGDLIPANAKMSLDSTYSNAYALAAAIKAAKDGGDDGTSGLGNTFNYTQNISSPKAVSTVEVYRNTKNQISTVKGALST